MVAVKKILLKDLQESQITQLTNQVNLLASLSHPNIVKYEGVTRDRDTLNVVLEYVSPLYPWMVTAYTIVSGMREMALWVMSWMHLRKIVKTF